MRFALKSLWCMCLLLAVFCLAAPSSADSGLARHKKMYAVPAPRTAKIDGKLTGWDLSAMINMYVVSETADMQSAKFALMYDKNALYLGAIVRDPTPMMNRHAPETEGNFGWDADSFQFRMVFSATPKNREACLTVRYSPTRAIRPLPRGKSQFLQIPITLPNRP